MQAKWGTHGDHPVIALTPESVTETFYLTIRAFNLAEKYRTPVMLLTDEVVGHMREKIEIPNIEDIEIYDRIQPTPEENHLAYHVHEGELVPRMAPFGSGHHHHVTGLFHDEDGFPSNSSENAKVMLNHLMHKVSDNLDDIVTYDEFMTEDAEVLILAYGSTSRTARSSVKSLRAAGIKAGLFRPITIWPSPEQRISELAKNVDHIIVAEMNYGQYVLEVERIVKSDAQVYHIGRANGEVLIPSEISDKVKEVLK